MELQIIQLCRGWAPLHNALWNNVVSTMLNDAVIARCVLRAPRNRDYARARLLCP